MRLGDIAVSGAGDMHEPQLKGGARPECPQDPLQVCNSSTLQLHRALPVLQHAQVPEALSQRLDATPTCFLLHLKRSRECRQVPAHVTMQQCGGGARTSRAPPP